MAITKSKFLVRQNKTPHKQVGPYFATREEAQKYIDDNNLVDVQIGESFSVDLF